jgi:hypothetical protein
LILNTGGMGVWATKLYAGTSGDEFFRVAMGLLALVPYLLAARRLRWNAGWTFLAGLGLFKISSWAWRLLFPAHFAGAAFLTAVIYYVFLRRVVSHTLRRALAGFGVIGAGGFVTAVVQHLGAHVPRATGLLAERGAATLLGLTVLWLVRDTRWKIPALLFCAAALGNELSLLLPPYAIVDFFYAAVLAQCLGHGVMNVADLYFDAAVASACVLAARAAFLGLRGRTLGAAALDEESLEN